MIDDMTNVYEFEADVTLRIKSEMMADGLDDLKVELEEYVKNWIVGCGDRLMKIDILRSHKIAEYNLETDEEFRL